MKIITGVVFLFLAFEFSLSPCSAVEIAERISDREIVERLTRIEEGHKSLNNRFDDVNKRFDDVNKRFDDVNRRFDDVNKRIDDLGHIMNARFEDVNERLGDIMNFLHILAGAMLVVGGGVLGWLVVMWKRLARIEEKQRRFETQDSEITFLKESYTKLNEMLINLLKLFKPPRDVL